MDMPPPVDIKSPPAQVEVIEYGDPDEAYKELVLDRIDGPDIPDNVKQFAKNNNCLYVMKKYYWSYKLFKDEGGVYSCNKNNKVQYIYEYDNIMRFAKWYEKHKFKKIIYEN